MNQALEQRLNDFYTQNQFRTKGPLSVVLGLTRRAIINGLPLDPETLLTRRKGQVKGLGESAVSKILKEYGILRVLAKEGGRTSRGSMDNMERYVQFLNQLYMDNLADLSAIEGWWIERVKIYFASQPFVLRYDVSQSLRSVIRDLLDQAKKRQEENPGTTYIGSVLQHLVGAKLDLVLSGRNIEIKHHGASVADAPSAREGDFIIERMIIHVTTSPTNSLIQKCQDNLAGNYKVIIVTTNERVSTAEGLAEDQGIGNRVDIFSAEQFLAFNLHELSGFNEMERNTTIAQLVAVYNQLIDKYETDPSLRISIGK